VIAWSYCQLRVMRREISKGRIRIHDLGSIQVLQNRIVLLLDVSRCLTVRIESAKLWQGGALSVTMCGGVIVQRHSADFHDTILFNPSGIFSVNFCLCSERAWI
jgi:hypothetical protein